MNEIEERYLYLVVGIFLGIAILLFIQFIVINV